ncbi:hypothetical protein SUDANB176_05051 [Streptomyces sp. enrichment culture]|uniref:hypothetical protein n=1 Tax=Streptomyces sp. enrichment culture TaxID=1795815 RepID=UPI003F57AA4F
MGHVREAQDESLGRPVAVEAISLLAGGGSRGDEEVTGRPPRVRGTSPHAPRLTAGGTALKPSRTCWAGKSQNAGSPASPPRG